jgi:hypothetical protein
MKIKFNDLPDGFEVRNGQVVEVKQSGGSTGDQNNYGLVTTPKDHIADDELNVKYSMAPVPKDEANIEAERGETVLTDLNGDGKFGLYDIQGKRHARGGTPLFLPEQSFVFSDFNKMKFTKEEMEQMGVTSKKKQTPAKISKKFSINEFYASLKDPYADEIQANTADLMLEKNKMQLSKLAFLQESKKDFEDGVPVSSFPFLVEQGQDPIAYMQEVENINKQKAEEKFISSLPPEQQMQIAALQQYMEQVDQQKQGQQEEAQQQGMLPPAQDQGMQMPPEMQQMQGMQQGMPPQGMPSQGQSMMPPPPGMNPQQMAQMGYEMQDMGEYNPYDMPMAQGGIETLPQDNRTDEQNKQYTERINAIENNLFSRGYTEEDINNVLYGIIADKASSSNYNTLISDQDIFKKTKLRHPKFNSYKDKMLKELLSRGYSLDSQGRDPNGWAYGDLEDIAEQMVEDNQRLGYPLDDPWKDSNIEEQFEIAKTAKRKEELVKKHNKVFYDNALKELKKRGYNTNAEGKGNDEWWNAGKTYENLEEIALAISQSEYPNINSWKDNELLEAYNLKKGKAWTDDLVKEEKRRRIRKKNNEQIRKEYPTDEFIEPEVDPQTTPQTTPQTKPQATQKPVSNQYSDPNYNPFAKGSFNDPNVMSGDIDPFFPGADNYQKNKDAYNLLEKTLTDVNDTEMQGIINESYNRFLENAKEQGLTNMPSKEELINEFLKYQKNNYNVRNLATEKDRFNPNLDKAVSIGKKRNQIASELFEKLAKENSEYEGYEINDDNLKAVQLYFQTLYQVDSEKDNPRFGVEQLGPGSVKNWEKNKKISQADEWYGNDTLNQFMFVANPKQQIEPDKEPENPVIKTKPQDEKINIQPNQLKVPYNPNDPRFWLQDLLKLNAIASRKRKKFYPWQPAVEDIDIDWVLEDPTRAIAATNEQMNLMAQGLGTFGGPQSFNSRMANVQAKTAANIANITAGVHNRNINTVNRGLAQQAQYDHLIDKENRIRKTKLYDDTMKVEQNALIEENFDREQYADALASAYTNMANTYNMNTLYDNFNVDPTTGGMMYFTNPTALDPSPNYQSSKMNLYKQRRKQFMIDNNRDWNDWEAKMLMGEEDDQPMNNYQREMQNKQNPGFIQGYDYTNTGQRGKEVRKLLPFFVGHVGI